MPTNFTPETTGQEQIAALPRGDIKTDWRNQRFSKRNLPLIALCETCPVDGPWASMYQGIFFLILWIAVLLISIACNGLFC